jgi:hypothetical protein
MNLKRRLKERSTESDDKINMRIKTRTLQQPNAVDIKNYDLPVASWRKRIINWWRILLRIKDLKLKNWKIQKLFLIFKLPALNLKLMKIEFISNV